MHFYLERNKHLLKTNFELICRKFHTLWRENHMKREIPLAMILVLGFTLVLGAGLYAQVKKDQKTGLDRIEGSIQAIDKDNSTLSVKQSEHVVLKVVYNDETAVTRRNKAAEIGDLKEGLRVIVLGKFENNELNASRIEIRTEK